MEEKKRKEKGDDQRFESQSKSKAPRASEKPSHEGKKFGAS